MNIVNLTKEGFKFSLVPDSVLKMDRALLECGHCHGFSHVYDGIIYWDHTFLQNAFSPLFQYSNQVPVFFVTTDMCGKQLNVAFLGQSMHVTVPPDKMGSSGFDEDIETVIKKIKQKDNENDNGPRDKEDENKDDIFEPGLIIDLWGVYVGSALRIHKLENAHPKIFIWVDKIYNYVQQVHNGDSSYYNLITCQVILHEMMHALMDINIIGGHYRNNIPDWFRVLREESLAEAGSLTMMDGVWTKKDMNYLKKLVASKGRPLQYRLGASYYSAGNDVVNRAIECWLKRCFNPKLAMDWLIYILKYFPKLDKRQLALYEKGFRRPYVFKYRSSFTNSKNLILYSDKDLVINIIRDYAKKNKPPKSELLRVFPTTLNEDYDVFIDPLTQDHFDDKLGPFTRSIVDNHDVACSDGKLIICDYWHPNSMHPFVEHARNKLGFNIIDFWP